MRCAERMRSNKSRTVLKGFFKLQLLLSCSFRTQCLMPLDHCTAILLVTFILPAWLGCWVTKESLWSLKNFLKSSKVWYVKIFTLLPIECCFSWNHCRDVVCYLIPRCCLPKSEKIWVRDYAGIFSSPFSLSFPWCVSGVFKNQVILSLLIIFLILMTCVLDQEVIFKG